MWAARMTVWHVMCTRQPYASPNETCAVVGRDFVLMELRTCPSSTPATGQAALVRMRRMTGPEGCVTQTVCRTCAFMKLGLVVVVVG